MPESVESRPAENRSSKTALAVGAAVIVILLAVALYLIVNLRGRVVALEAAATQQSAETKVIEEKVHLTNKNVEEGMEALGSKVGMTEDEIAARTAELKAQQERAAAKLAAAQQATNKEVANVNSEVSGVKTELGGAQNDIASTRSDLAATNAKLETAIGDLNVHSGLIAKNHDESGVSEAQRRPQLLRVHAEQEAAHPDFDREPGVEEGGPEEVALYAQCLCGRSHHREEGPHAGRASAVLHRARPSAV